MTQAAHQKTAPFELGPGGDKARMGVLLLHGFTGSPWDLRPLGESLSERGFHVIAPRLPGHGTAPEAMLWVTWRQWLRAAEEALEALSGLERVAVVGLSMGSLLALLLAARHPKRIKALVLLAPALSLRDRKALLLRALRELDWVGVLPQWVTKKSTDIEASDIRRESPLLPRYPVARLRDLFTLQDLAWAAVPQVRCPCLIIAARMDHVVDEGAIAKLHEQLHDSHLLTLERGFHIVPRDNDRALAATKAAEFLERAASSE